ncbi:SNF2 family N-terminal domain-containing protein [Bisporella sp. PMI_857]|nr:SNF2 family N-terminal domain-containing protein [Bisporella sp. PMI_857]
MSQPLSPASQAAVTDVVEEIEFQKVLLASIDNSVKNREEARAEVKAEIRRLEKQLKTLRLGKDTAASHSWTSSALQPSQSSPTPTSRSNATARANQDLASQQATSSSTSSTPTSSMMNSNDEFLSPSMMNLPNRKRSHTAVEGGLKPFTDNKSRRTSPSPYENSPTPSSSGESDFDELDAELFSNNAAYLQQQSAAQERAAALKADEEYARSIGSGMMTAPPSTANNAFSRMAGFGRSSSATVASGSAHLSSSSRANPFRHNPAAQTLASSGSSSATPTARPKVKNETRASTVNNEFPSIPGAFVDDSSNTSDSDIEIIPPSAWRDNGRFNNSPSRPQNRDSSALQMAMFGNQPLPSWQMNGSPMTSHPFGSMSGPLQGTMQHPFGATTVPVTGYDGTNVYNAAGFGSGPHSFNGSAFHNMQSVPSLDLTGIDNDDALADGIANIRANMDMFSGSGFDQLDYIMNDPRKTNEEIKSLLENIKPDVDVSPESRDGTPDGLKYPLYEHQKIALTWLKAMESGSNKGGILADDMGLGKTISSLALILSSPSADRRRKTTLIVGPVALIRQWEREISKKVKVSHRLSVHLAHGAKKKLSWDELTNYDIVMTSYGTLAAEFRRLESYKQEHKNRGILEADIDHAPMKKLFPMLGPSSHFYRVILDEAQCVKNKNALSSKAACNLAASTRFCLTGTPMMNNIDELQSLIKFLKIKPYNDPSEFKKAFGSLTKGNATKRATNNSMRKLQALLKAILLRRTKNSIIDGKPIITLPPKTEEISHVVFDESEQEFYNALEQRTRLQFNKYMRAGTVGKNYSNVLVLLLRLRQCCCHPHLIQDFEQAPTAEISKEDAIEIAKSLTPDVVARLLAADGFECPVCYDGVVNPLIAIPCGHDICSECLSQITQQQAAAQVAAGNDNATGVTARCPSCRGAIQNSIDYAIFKKCHGVDDEEASVKADVDEEDDNSGSSDVSDDETDSDDDSDVDKNGDLRGFIVPDASFTDDEDDGGEDEEDPIEDDALVGEATTKQKKEHGTKAKEKRRLKKIKSGKKAAKKTLVSMAMLKKDASRSKANKKRYFKYLRKNWQPSAKITKCVELLEKFVGENQKTIIFSQFVSLLDLLQVPIEKNGWSFERYDGSMKADERHDAVNRFTDKPNTKIMLISLKAGNAGLNLVAASKVIILDPFWNPFIEMQAVDRAYRIGQQRPVEVHRILIRNTVEDRIIELQEQKKELVNMALDEGSSKNISRLGERELAFLFGVGAE